MALACTISRHGLYATIDGSRLDNGSYNPKQCGGLSAVLCCAVLRNVMAPLKLQKMGLYVDAWCMVLNDGEALIAERFEAWVHGPSARDLCILLAVYNW